MLLDDRFLQGVGTQGTNSAGVAIILETSQNVQSDMGFQELMVGFAYMAGPFAGGWMYKHFGGCPPAPSIFAIYICLADMAIACDKTPWMRVTSGVPPPDLQLAAPSCHPVL